MTSTRAAPYTTPWIPGSRSPMVASSVSLIGTMIAAPSTGPHFVPTPPTRQTTSVCTITRTPKTASGVTT
ncbi:MAG: hypothetical protein A2X50_03515 [Candidatus Rokubacteria bacterium GWF2_70_14]|nr:MAG: hypothetical protein A2X50_03515 [Candidatus Rokubacteria bacterium GWF2_70_14]